MTQAKKAFKGQKPVNMLVTGAAVGVLVVLGALGKLAYDGQRYNAELAAELGVEKARMNRMIDDVDRLDQLLKKYPKDIARFEKVLFKDKDIPQFLEGLSTLSRRFDTNVQSINQGVAAKVLRSDEGADAPPLQAAAFHITLVGEMANILLFLQEIEKSAQLLTISEMTMSVKDYPSVTCTFTLDLYSLNMAPAGTEASR